MLQRLVNQRRQGSFRGGAWFPRLPDHCRENSPTSRGEVLLVLLQAAIALIQHRTAVSVGAAGASMMLLFGPTVLPWRQGVKHSVLSGLVASAFVMSRDRG